MEDLIPKIIQQHLIAATIKHYLNKSYSFQQKMLVR